MSEDKVIIGKSLAKKILAVQKGAANIPKNGYNDFHKYHYVLAADAVEAIRKLCVENDLVITTLGVNGATKFSENAGTKKDQTVTEVHITYLVMDPESGESLTFDWVGHGSDTLDKGIFKAFTGAQKYGIMQFFMVAGDDADPETATARDRKDAKRAVAGSGEQATTGPKTMKSKYDNGFCWYCKRKHVQSGDTIYGVDGVEGESKTVWGCKEGYEKWQKSRLAAQEAQEGPPEAATATTLEESGPIPGHEQTAKQGELTLKQVQAMTPAKKMDALLSKPKADLVALANRELAQMFENNTKVGDQYLLALLEEKRLTSVLIEENSERDIARMICDLWDRKARKATHAA